MADRTANIILETKDIRRLAVPIANGVTLPIGSLVQEESGFANHFDGTNTLLGIVVGGENTNADGEPVGDTSLTPDPAVYVDTSGPTICGIAVDSATVIGAYVYTNDTGATSNVGDLSITQNTTDAPVGVIVRFGSATDCDVRLFSYIEHLLGRTAAATPGGSWV
jgi:hypothetical protein